jgi:hypothetical protein
VSSQENFNMGPMGNVPMNSQYNIPEKMRSSPQAVAKPVTGNAMTYRAVYPEIYYKIMPFITMTCDLILSFSTTMPTQQQLEEMSDGIYMDFCKMYPDMADYMSKASGNDDPPADPLPFHDGFRDGFRDGEEFREGFRPGFRFRRRGLGRDFIDGLLLSELSSRGRYYY